MINRLSLQGKVAVITGASRGIGRAIALAFAESGADIVVSGRSIEDISKTAEDAQELYGVKSLVIPADVSNPSQVKEMIDKAIATFGQVDVLVNNAGINHVAPFSEISDVQWKRIFDVNVHGVFYATKAVVHHMMERRSGKIINISSMDSVIGVPHFTAYCASKGAVSQLTRALAAELARYNIQVNAICPGYVRTSMTEDALENEEILKKILSRIPLRRVGEPEEIAWLAVYLASQLSDYMTGQLVLLDGGQTVI